METFFSEKLKLLGRTPLFKLERLSEAYAANIFVKLEMRNPTYSVKDRIAWAMIEDACNKGLLKPGGTIIEPTSGNTGIALAGAAAALGFKAILTMPETMSLERRTMLKALGAELILTDAASGMTGAVKKAEQLARDTAGAIMLQQFENPANPAAHEASTGPEIWEQMGGKLDVFVSAIGTGGTFTGVSRFLKKTKNAPVTCVAVEPAESPVISQHLAGEPIKASWHKIQGIGAGFVPKTLDTSLIDRVEKVSSQQAIATARLLMEKEGLMAGISSGAAVRAAVQLVQLEAFKGKNILVILADSAERYISTDLFKAAD